MDTKNSNSRTRTEPQKVGWDGGQARSAEEIPIGRIDPNPGDLGANGGPPAPFSPWPLVETIVRRWFLVFLAGCAVAVLAFFAGLKFFQTRYTATAQLLRFETPNNSEFFKPRQLSEQTFASMLRSPELLQKVSALAKPPLTPERLNSSLNIIPERNSDVVSVGITAHDRQAAISTANLFADESVRFTKELQAGEAKAADGFYLQQLAEMDRERADLVRQMQQAARETARLAVRPAQMHDRFQTSLMEKLQAAREDLVTLLSKYTELHPAVREQRARIEELQRQLNGMAAETPTEAGRPVEQIAPGPLAGSSTNSSAGTRKESDFEILRTQLQALETARTQLAGRQREAQLFEKDAPGYAQLLAPATLKSVTAKDGLPKIILLTAFGGMMGVAGCIMLLLGAEFMDERLKTAADVKRVTRLPLLSSVGNLHRLDSSSQDRWAFRTWTALQNRLSCSPNHGLVCGITSARAGEGRSTWLRLLAQAASQCGFRVLTIGTAPNPDPDESGGFAESDGESNGDPDYNSNGTALTTHVLSSPALVTEKLVGNDPQPYVHIPLPGWVWNLERRREWQSALNQWSKIQNIVILVELPPASVPEAILLAENLPNLVWLTRSGTATAAETRLHLETLRLARSQVVGAVLNREPAPPLQHRFQRWFGCGAALLALSCNSLRAADPAANSAKEVAPPPPGVTAPAAVAPPTDTAPAPQAGQVPTALPATNFSFSVSSPKRAPWQEHFTLGPGDVLNFSLYGQPELSRAEVFVGPDGRVSFLQAQDIVAAGLTVDELRAKFDDELGKFYRTPRTIISPVAFHSKKYYVLGKVMNRGLFPLDRPLTIVEALARAKGLEIGLLPDNRNMVDLADLQRSFVMRRGKRLPVNLEKLFQEGDLSQNVALEPEDYLYFAAANLKQVYVLGEVNLPGPLPYTGNMTAVGAISARGGFTQRAYKGKVLVIRGSLNRPQTFVVDVWEATEGRARDMKLEPKDIVYVNYRPFIKAEDLLDLGITAFLQSVTVEWTGLHIDPRTQ